eukprot:TRINITY_DN18716_c0_g1_i1.p1 TRINITY_DN18716_c0_g1~~TRINITY_DN18716_c0_g1_i1.p1  ORF type:complete len:444 (+),score=83.47 TRINITY_DN18716_c0_g1_i1:63-1394(+)
MDLQSLACPVCFHNFPVEQIEDHVQQCLDASNKENEKLQILFPLTVNSSSDLPSLHDQITSDSPSSDINKQSDTGESPNFRQSKESQELDEAFIKRLFRLTEKKPSLDDQKALIVGHLIMMFRHDQHPLGKKLQNFILVLNSKFEDKFLLLSDILAEINSFKVHLCDDVMAFYEKQRLNLRSFPSAFFITAIDEVLFPAINDNLTQLYHQQYQETDEQCEESILRLLTVTPPHLDIPHKYWMQPPVVTSPKRLLTEKVASPFSRGPNSARASMIPTSTPTSDHLNSIINEKNYLEYPPFYHATNCLKKLSSYAVPSQKFKCFSDTVQLTCQAALCFSHGWSPSDRNTIVTDELIEMLAYVMIKANVKNIYSQRMLCSDFLSSEDLLGMPGYLLCSFQTSLEYLLQLNPSSLSVPSYPNLYGGGFGSAPNTPQLNRETQVSQNQ